MTERGRERLAQARADMAELAHIVEFIMGKGQPLPLPDGGEKDE